MGARSPSGSPYQNILGIFKGTQVLSNKSFPLSAEINVPLCDVANKHIGVKASDTLSVGVQKDSLTTQNKLKVKFGFVDKFGYSVKANAKIIDFKIGDGTISCEGLTGISGSDFRNIKFEIGAKIGITWDI